jgi:nicotinic acid mononucleotide adenylyltransferase
LRMVTFCVAHRPGYSLSPPPALAGGEFLPFAAPEWGISATSLRAYLARGYRCRFLVPEEVRQYIASHRLYSSTSGGTASRKHVLRLPE